MYFETTQSDQQFVALTELDSQTIFVGQSRLSTICFQPREQLPCEHAIGVLVPRKEFLMSWVSVVWNQIGTLIDQVT